MILELLDSFGLNSSLAVDLGGVAFILCAIFAVMVLTMFKGIAVPILRTKFKKENIAVVDLGGIETPLINYPRGAVELVWEHKDNKYSWNIPTGIERTLPNGSKYILANSRMGGCFNQYAIADAQTADELLASSKVNEVGQPLSQGDALNISRVAEILGRIRIMLSPKGQANTIDDRAKQIADKAMSNVNKPLIYGAVIAILFIVVIGCYLIVTKAMEYQLCSAAQQAASYAYSTTSTLPQLPPLN